jgi:predicted nucleotidyltransferase component of viral defense system
MIDYIREQIRGESDRRKARLLVREYLQARILESLHDSGVFSTWCFIGGTALRFLYRLPRFSEDLDFSLSQALAGHEHPRFTSEFNRTVDRTISMFQKEGYTVSPRINDARVVKSAFIKFHGLLFELGLSPHEREVVSVKIEIDGEPPSGAQSESSIIRKYSLLNIQHYDKSSLFAEKLHALLSRDYTKGRDLYDTLWYLSDPEWPAPNINFLQNALEQTGWSGPEVTSDNWTNLVSDHLKTINWNKAIADVQPFLEKPQEASLLTQENFTKLLSSDQ